MVWAVQSVVEFERWFLNLESAIRVEIAAKISLLQQVGPTLGRPHADTLKGFGLSEHEGAANPDRW